MFGNWPRTGALASIKLRLTSLVPLKIVQVELEKHGFGFQNTWKTQTYKRTCSEIKVLGCGDGIPRCRLCSHGLCHQFQAIFNPFWLKIYQILLESSPNPYISLFGVSRWGHFYIPERATHESVFVILNVFLGAPWTHKQVIPKFLSVTMKLRFSYRL